MNKYNLLRKLFGFSEFRDIQGEVIGCIVSQNNALCLMPTGGGKSLIYQIAGLLLKKTTIVISPLIALMQQQHSRLESIGLSSIFLHGDIEGKKQYEIIRSMFKAGHPDFIFISPERVGYDGYLEYIMLKNRDRLGLVVIDEAHCVSQWGHTFRPLYKSIPNFLNSVFGENSWIPILCLTATINPKDREEICQDFKIGKEYVFRSGDLRRKNIEIKFYKYENEDEKKNSLHKFLSMHASDKIIVYTHRKRTKYGTRECAKEFKKEGFNCDYFDADRTKAMRKQVLDNFEKGETKIIFATNAFGMGIDIDDIRVVIHYLMPESIEQYYQEIGRCGRDGKPSYAYLLYTNKNIKVRNDLINAEFNKARRLPQVYEKFNPKTEGRIFTIAPWLDISEEDLEHILLYYLIRKDIFRVVCKGIRFASCFSGGENADELRRYKSFSNFGLIGTISKKLNLSVNTIIENLHEWFTDGKIKLVTGPQKVLFYQLNRELDDQIIEEIYEDIRGKLEYRLENLGKLAELIQSDTAHHERISQYLGLDSS